MRYIITQTQLHNIVYNFLDNMFDDNNISDRPHPYVDGGRIINLSSDDGETSIDYYYFFQGSGEQDKLPEYGVGRLHIHPNILDTLRQMIKIRETKVIDLVTDWFSEKFNVDVDDVSIYPSRTKIPFY